MMILASTSPVTSRHRLKEPVTTPSRAASVSGRARLTTDTTPSPNVSRYEPILVPSSQGSVDEVLAM